MTQQKNRISIIFQILILLIPLNIFVIGDWMGSGIQTLFFRYMQTNIGNSLIFLNREIYFVTSGIMTGKSAIASVVWFIGVTLICIATIMVIYANVRDESKFIRYGAFLNAGGAILFTLAILIQYGITLNGPAGIAIPFGIPVILGVAYYQNKIAADEVTDSEKDDEDYREENPVENEP